MLRSNGKWCHVHVSKFDPSTRLHELRFLDPATGVCVCVHTYDLNEEGRAVRWFDDDGKVLEEHVLPASLRAHAHTRTSMEAPAAMAATGSAAPAVKPASGSGAAPAPAPAAASTGVPPAASSSGAAAAAPTPSPLQAVADAPRATEPFILVRLHTGVQLLTHANTGARYVQLPKPAAPRAESSSEGKSAVSGATPNTAASPAAGASPDAPIRKEDLIRVHVPPSLLRKPLPLAPPAGWRAKQLDVTARDDPHGLLYRRLQVYWARDHAWYSARVLDYRADNDYHYIVYDDGQRTWCSMYDIEHVVVPEYGADVIGRKVAVELSPRRWVIAHIMGFDAELDMHHLAYADTGEQEFANLHARNYAWVVDVKSLNPGEPVLGRRVQVYSPNVRMFFSGTVTEYSPTQGGPSTPMGTRVLHAPATTQGPLPPPASLLKARSRAGSSYVSTAAGTEMHPAPRTRAASVDAAARDRAASVAEEPTLQRRGSASAGRGAIGPASRHASIGGFAMPESHPATPTKTASLGSATARARGLRRSESKFVDDGDVLLSPPRANTDAKVEEEPNPHAEPVTARTRSPSNLDIGESALGLPAAQQHDGAISARRQSSGRAGFAGDRSPLPTRRPSQARPFPGTPLPPAMSPGLARQPSYLPVAVPPDPHAVVRITLDDGDKIIKPLGELDFVWLEDHISGTPRARGAVGLLNMGNTCYLNSILQCLAHVDALTAYCLDESFSALINTANKAGMRGRMALAYADTLSYLWGDACTALAPGFVKALLSERSSVFNGMGQQDAHEALMCLLECLHEDLAVIDHAASAAAAVDARLAAEEEERERQLQLADIAVVSQLQGDGQHAGRVDGAVANSVAMDVTGQSAHHGRTPSSSSTSARATTAAGTHDPASAAGEAGAAPTASGGARVGSPALDANSPSPSAGTSKDPKAAQSGSGMLGWFRRKTTATPLARPPSAAEMVFAGSSDHPEARVGAAIPAGIVEQAASSSTNGVHARGTESDSGGAFPTPSSNSGLSEATTVQQSPPPGGDASLPSQAPGERAYASPATDVSVAHAGERPSVRSDRTLASTEPTEVVQNANASSSGDSDHLPAAGQLAALPSAAPTDAVAADIKLAAPPAVRVDQRESNAGDALSLAITPLPARAETTSIVKTLLFVHMQHEYTCNGKPRHTTIRPGPRGGEMLPPLPVTGKKEEKAGGFLFKRKILRDPALPDCLEAAFAPEHVERKCDKCGKVVTMTSRPWLKALPPVLVVQLKRFEYQPSTNTHAKVAEPVLFPARDLDMSPYVSHYNAATHGPSKYDLLGVVIHFGTMERGHYTAYARNTADGQWFYYDDSVVTPVTEADVLNEQNTKLAYLLFYTRRMKGQAPPRAVPSLSPTAVGSGAAAAGKAGKSTPPVPTTSPRAADASRTTTAGASAAAVPAHRVEAIATSAPAPPALSAVSTTGATVPPRSERSSATGTAAPTATVRAADEPNLGSARAATSGPAPAGTDPSREAAPATTGVSVQATVHVGQAPA